MSDDVDTIREVLRWSSHGPPSYEGALAALGRVVAERDELRARLQQQEGQALGGASGASSTAATRHDNGESPVDDPECGTDIGPHHSSVVLTSDEFQALLAEIYDARVTGRSAEAFGALLAHDRLLRAEVSGGTSTGSARPPHQDFDKRPASSDGMGRTATAGRATQDPENRSNLHARVVLLEEALRRLTEAVAAERRWATGTAEHNDARSALYAAAEIARAVLAESTKK